MKRLSWIGVGAAALLFAACGRSSETPPPAAAAAPASPTVERAGPVRWDAATGAFELAGKPLKTVKLWTFDGSTDGFTPVRSTVAPAPGQGLAVKIADPTLRSPKGLNVPGGQYPLVLVRLTRTAAGEAWDGALYYSTANHQEAIGFLGKPLDGVAPGLNETVTLVYDMSHQTIGAPDWSQSTIEQIRLDMEDKAGGAFVIHQIAIASDPDPDALAPPTPPAAAAPKP